MNSRLIFLLLILSIASCADQQQELRKAEVLPVEIKTKIVKVPTPVPMPGQLKRIPTRAKNKPLPTAAVIDKANEKAMQKPRPDGFFNAMMVYDYMPGALYQLYAAPLKITSILLEEGEQLISVALGDGVRWKAESITSGTGAKKRYQVLIKNVGSQETGTNIIITTDKRIYNFEAHSYEKTYMASIMFNYGNDEIALQKAAEETAGNKVIDTNVNLKELNFDYDVKGSGNIAWKPKRVFDDGLKTYIQFPKILRSSEAPVLFILSDEDNTQLVNYRVKDDYYIVDRIFDRAELRVGEKKPAIVTIERN